jgi:hypothetical protein
MAKGGMSFTFSEKDYVELQRMLEGIANVDQKQAIINSLKRSTRNMIIGGKANLTSRNKVKKGNLSKSFRASSSKKKVVAYAGFNRSGAHKGNHAHLVDRGTDKRWTKKGAYRGSISKGTPNKGSMFWTDSVMAQGPKAMENLKNTIYQELEKITRRRNK